MRNSWGTFRSLLENEKSAPRCVWDVGVGGYKPCGFYIPTPNHLGKIEVFGKCSKKMKGNATNINVTPYELCAYNYNGKTIIAQFSED